MVEVGELLPEVEVLHEGRTALTGGERVVGVVDPDALVGGERPGGRVVGVKTFALTLFAVGGVH